MDIYAKLDQLRKMPSETEIVEFKRAERNYDFSKLGKYFSALSNEANLKGVDIAWLVFGIDDTTHKVVGTAFRSNSKDLESLKHELAVKTTGGITFHEIHELILSEGRVLLFEILPAPKGIPLAFEGHYYGRDGASLSALNISELEQIRAQANNVDWSSEIIPDATLDDLDPEAIQIARIKYKERFGNDADVNQWDDITFLNKAKVIKRGKITRAAIVLLGKSESEHFLNPAATKIRWLLKDAKGFDRDYQIETCPFIITVDKIYSKIRNVKYRYMPDGTLFPQEMDTYAPFIIREAINNCIAHQEYLQGTFINVVEMDDKLVFSNRGSFLPGSVERVVLENAPEEKYRNPFLATAMFNLKLIETRGGGIREIFKQQASRFFPLPEYELSPSRVQVTITGRVLDMDYANILAKHQDLNLEEIMLLDKVQKKKSLSEEEEKHLRSQHLIEGRKPNYFITKDVAQKTGQKAEYSKLKGFEEQYYSDLILKALGEHKMLTRQEIDALLRNKLPDVLSEQQKTDKIKNLLSKLKKQCEINCLGRSTKAVWMLSDKDSFETQ